MKPAVFKLYLLYCVIGLMLGATLAKVGFADYDQVFSMFTFSDLRMLITFMLATGLAAVVFYVLKLSTQFELDQKHYHPGTVLGSVIFGAGWFFCGACPAIILVQLGQGKIIALISLIGMLVGIRLYRLMHARYFLWDTGSCGL